MKPLYSFGGDGWPISGVIGQLTTILNKILSDRDFEYRETIVTMDYNQTKFGAITPVAHVVIVVQADRLEDIADLEAYLKNDPEAKGLFPDQM